MLRRLQSKLSAGLIAGAVRRRQMSTLVQAGGVASLASGLLSIPKRYPFRFACIFTSLKTFSADIFVQTVMEKTEKIDWKRSSVFAVFGFCYQGAFQYVVYVHLVAGRLLPNAAKYAALSFRQKLQDLKGGLQLLAQVGIANFIMDPCFCLPTYYVIKEAILGEADETLTTMDRVKVALAKYRKNAFEDITTSWKIWMPAQLVNFGLMPLHLRVPFISIVSFGYCIVLSVMRGASDEEIPTQDAERLHQSCTDAQSILIEEELRSFHPTSQAFERAVIRNHKNKGQLSRQDFENMFSSLGIQDRRAMSRLFQCFDLDKDGAVSPEEFATLVLTLTGRGSPEDMASSIFEICDLDGNGEVGFEELKTMLRAFLRMESTLLMKAEGTGLVVSTKDHLENPTKLMPVEVMNERAHALAVSVMDEMTESQQHKEGITVSEFRRWAEEGSETAEKVLRVFRAFAPQEAIK